MRLEAVYGGDPGTAGTDPSVTPAGTRGIIRISEAKQQLIGVRTDVVERARISNALRVAGRIAVDEARLFRIIAANDGWLRELGSSPAGTFVQKDEILASYYVRDLVSTQQSYLYALDINSQYEQAQTTNVLQRNTAGVTLRQALDALRSLGMTDLQIEELRRTHTAASELRIYSPATGFILARNLSPGQRFDKGVELYRIADISRIWVMADIFEKDQELLQPGAMAMVRYRGREFSARMSGALPQFDPQSRTLKTRFELDNPGNILRPGMFVDVEVQVNMPAAITVPGDAVIDSGLRQTVYVDRGRGLLEARQVKTGWRLGDRVQITEGLAPGDQIVVSGNFLIDSESRLKTTPDVAQTLVSAAPGLPGRGPVPGASAPQPQAGK
jgi:Cu(I)/Ag(I) efflux system membrane fusion protein